MTLKISKLSKRYNNEWILRDISLEIEKGEILGLIGGSESGRSTLLRLIHGSDKPTSGVISFDGRDLTSLGEKERGFSMSPTSVPKGWKSLFSGSSQNNFSDSRNQIELFLHQIQNSASVALFDNPFSSLTESNHEKYIGI